MALDDPIADKVASSADKGHSEVDEPLLPFPIVGVGASAGGLEALTDLFSSLPPCPGMAFIVVQHLHPGHASMLAGILNKQTAMPVTEAIEGVAIELDHVYVIPPNTSMTMVRGRLTLRPRDDRMRPPMPIDDLLESLAEEQTVNAIGVILSGTGSDGALAMRIIKANGGITFAQDERSARFSGMPMAAIGEGYVDLVMPPREIAEELGRIGRNPYLRWRNLDPVRTDEDELKRLFVVLRKTCDIDFSHYKRGTVQRRVARRLALLNLETINDYLAFIESNAGEGRALCQDLLIRVTSFFRDPETFEGLTNIVFPRLMEDRPPTTPLRIWVPGCASGEEVYSIAICLLESLGERALGLPIQIFGTDVSETAIRTARAGRYIENIARDVSAERLQRFFVKINEHYQIVKPVRDLCVFAPQNVARDPPYSRVDLISCRNLLIYLDPLLQKRVIPLFHYALSPGGFLMLGRSETIGAFSDLFSVVDNGKRIYGRKPPPERTRLQLADDYASRRPSAREMNIAAAPAPNVRELVQRQAESIVLARYVPPGVLCDEELNVVQFFGDTSPYLHNPPGPPSLALRTMARGGLFIALSNAIAQARKDAVPVRSAGLRVELDSGIREISLRVSPVQRRTAGLVWFLIFFEEIPLPARTRPEQPDDRDTQIAQLERELAAAKEYIQTIEDEDQSSREGLEAFQEELLSGNEELQSTNEELQTAKEELQSTNEELNTTNDELRQRIRELADLTKKMERARDFADAIVATVHEPLLVLDQKLRIQRANPSFYECFKTSRDVTEGGLIYEVGNRQWDIPSLRILLDETLSQRASFQDYEVTHVFPEIGQKTMRLNAHSLDWPGHELILLAIEDVTAREVAIRALQESDRRKDEFLAMLAHELRNPLAALRNALELGRRDDVDGTAKKHAVAMQERQLAKLTRLVDDLLDLSRITSGSIPLKIEPVDLKQIVSQAIEDLRQHLEAHQHEFVLALPAERLIVQGDAIRLGQVATNLLSNAAKYTEPGGRIAVALERQEDKAIFTVADTGIGIAPELLPAIFDIFVQAQRSLDRSEGGLGIGLTLVRRIVELHRGSVEAKSAGVNQGSEFVVCLPTVLRPSAESDVPTTRPQRAVTTTPRRILVVDDNADSAQGSAILLELEGNEVQIASSGLAAIEAAQLFRPQVVLLDIGLPGMNGYEVARRLRQLPVTENALLVALTGYGQEDDRRRSEEAGFNHHVVKPATIDQLNALIAAHWSD